MTRGVEEERAPGRPCGVARPPFGMVVTLGAAVGVLGLSAYLYGRFGLLGMAHIASPDMARHHDFEVFRRSATAWWAGGDLYEGNANLNPPVWLLPLSLLIPWEPATAFRLFTVTTVAVVVAYLVWTAKVLSLSLAVAVAAITGLLVSGPLQESLAQGQVYPCLAAGLVAAFVTERHGRERWSGLVLGVVAVLKPSLLPMVLWPALHRRWDGFRLALIGAAGTVVIGFVVGGPATTLRWAAILASRTQDGNDDDAAFSAHTVRLFSHTEFSAPLADVPWLTWSDVVLGAGVLVTTVVLAVRRPNPHLYWALIAACLLAAPIAWRAYLLLLAPGILVLLSVRRTRHLGALLLVLQLIPNTWALLFPDRDTTTAAVGLTLSCAILVTHWLVFVLAPAEAAEEPATARTGTPAPPP